ncbi:uncharacterized protein LOC62_05G006710 [Vanrija pseudolonga]|uniref:NAD-dependent epimerase/dehydratase domain-containing protein n=1 Tax=Vanrija pseudolonga TaxID=143232 RepID=A0AAF1BJV8_9TREE|nr:hypothetical protein LOC62_05G006710 [Vanrija pseudolonga]
MSTRSILVTGVTGYMRQMMVYCLVRESRWSPDVIKAGGVPILGSLEEAGPLAKVIVERNITTIVHLARGEWSDHRMLLSALARVESAQEKHYICLGRGESFSSATGWPHASVSDNDDVEALQRDATRCPSRDVELSVLETARACGIVPHVVVAPLVHGLGRGCGNRASNHVGRLVQAALKSGAAMYVLPGDEGWATVHVDVLAEYILAVLTMSTSALYSSSSRSSVPRSSTSPASPSRSPPSRSARFAPYPSPSASSTRAISPSSPYPTLSHLAPSVSGPQRTSSPPSSTPLAPYPSPPLTDTGTTTGGYYFAATSHVTWHDLASVLGSCLHARGLVPSADPTPFPSISAAARALCVQREAVLRQFSGTVSLSSNRLKLVRQNDSSTSSHWQKLVAPTETRTQV